MYSSTLAATSYLPTDPNAPGSYSALNQRLAKAFTIPPGVQSIDDIRALAGPSTPHFALQIRNRVRRLIAGLPADDPVRLEGERQIASLEDLAKHSGDPRGPASVS